jgi:hypothetical protein
MKRFILIMGCPGSGKSFLANNLHKEIPNSIVIDDISLIKPNKIPSLTDGYSYAIISCPLCCERTYRERFVRKLKALFEPDTVAIDYLFFENNPEQCKLNIDLRSDGRKVDTTLKKMSKLYEVPVGYAPIPVWKPPEGPV